MPYNMFIINYLNALSALSNLTLQPVAISKPNGAWNLLRPRRSAGEGQTYVLSPLTPALLVEKEPHRTI
jgi:hypothetical protein